MVLQDKELSPKQEEAKKKFIESRGFWSHGFNETLQLDPEFVPKYGDYSSYPGAILDSKLKELIHISIDVITTHEHSPRGHIRNAIEEGATIPEIMETIELAVCSGIESGLLTGTLILSRQIDELESDSPDAETIEALKNDFIDIFGYWTDEWEKLLYLDQEAFKRTMNLFAHPWKNGVLPPKDKELINIANAITSTHLSSIGTEIHINAALKIGASPQEVLAVIQTAACVGIHSATSFSTALIEESQEKGMLKDLRPRKSDDDLYGNR